VGTAGLQYDPEPSDLARFIARRCEHSLWDRMSRTLVGPLI
jgi:hypothetical protein